MVFDKKTFRYIFLGTAGCIVLYWGLHEMERLGSIFEYLLDILFPFLLGAGLAFVLNVPMRAFENWLSDIQKPSLRRALAITLTCLSFVLVLTIVFLLLIPQIGATIDALIPQILTFVEEAETWINDFLRKNPQLMQWIYENTGVETVDWGSLAQKVLSVVGESLSSIVGSAASAIGSITSLVVDLVVAIVFGLYCLARKEILARNGRMLLYAILPESWADYTVRVLRLTNSTFSNFLSGQCLEVCILGTLFAVSMAIFRMPYIPLVSVLVAVTAFIPVVGAFVGCIMGAFFILVDDFFLALGFVAMFLILQQIENNLIYPRVVGDSIGLPGMWVLLAVMLGGEFMGAAGMFLMIPLASVLYTLLGEWTHNRLDSLDIDPDKLRDHPPELYSIKKIRKENSESWLEKLNSKKKK